MLDQQFALELLDHATFTVMLNEGIVLLGRSLGQRMEPVCIVGNTLLHRPFLHAGSYGVCCFPIQRSTVVDGLYQFLKSLLR